MLTHDDYYAAWYVTEFAVKWRAKRLAEVRAEREAMAEAA
jgi:hypothetical protein